MNAYGPGAFEKNNAIEGYTYLRENIFVDDMATAIPVSKHLNVSQPDTGFDDLGTGDRETMKLSFKRSEATNW